MTKKIIYIYIYTYTYIPTYLHTYIHIYVITTPKLSTFVRVVKSASFATCQCPTYILKCRVQEWMSCLCVRGGADVAYLQCHNVIRRVKRRNTMHDKSRLLKWFCFDSIMKARQDQALSNEDHELRFGERNPSLDPCGVRPAHGGQAWAGAAGLTIDVIVTCESCPLELRR